MSPDKEAVGTMHPQFGPQSMVALLLSCVLLSGLLFPVSAAASVPDTTRVPDGFDLQGHRGARGLAPENTIPAFERALKIGVTTLEMDVVVAGDGTVVVSHEPWMAAEKCRTPEGERIPEGEEQSHNLHQMAYGEIEAYDCGSLRLDDFPEQTPTTTSKPRLHDVLRTAEAYVAEHDRPPAFYNIELKSRKKWEGAFQPGPAPFAERVLAVIEAAGVAPRTTLQSFDPRVLEAVHERRPPVRTAMLVWAEAPLDEHLNVLSFRPDVYSPPAQLVDAERVADAHDRGLSLVPWTVNDPMAMKSLVGLGVDGLITDYPDRGRRALRALDVPVGD